MTLTREAFQVFMKGRLGTCLPDALHTKLVQEIMRVAVEDGDPDVDLESSAENALTRMLFYIDLYLKDEHGPKGEVIATYDPLKGLAEDIEEYASKPRVLMILGDSSKLPRT